MKYILFVFIVLFFVSCASKTVQKSQSLESLLLHVTHNTKEAHLLAKDVKEYSLVLKNRYELTEFANFNNFLINIGFKKRGLCWQLVQDLLYHLKQKKYKVDYYIGVANKGEYFSEHNVLVLTCKKCSFYEGVLLDAWRNGGELYFSRVKDDIDFTWKQRGEKR